MARRSALRAWSRAFRACSTVLPVALGSTGRGTSSIDASSVWNHKRGGFAHPGERLVDGLTPGVDPWFFLELDRPAPVIFSFEAGGVVLHGLLRPVRVGVVCHFVSHFGPRHGSRSRSMDLSVPGVRSPAWTGTTVWQLPHRQIWWDPRWRTEWHPRSASLRISARAVTTSVYRLRRIPVQANRRVVFGSAFQVGMGQGDGVAHRGRRR